MATSSRATAPAVSLASIQPVITRIALAAGLAIALTGIVDVALLWVPFRFGAPEWEFATITSTFDSLALPTFGLSLIAVALVAHGQRGGLFTLGFVFGLFALFVLVGLALFGLMAPVTLRGTPAVLRSATKLVLLKAAVSALIYLALTVYLTSFSFTQARAIRRR